jgi:hypothetical protein
MAWALLTVFATVAYLLVRKRRQRKDAMTSPSYMSSTN